MKEAVVDELLPIGRFAELSRLSVKSLRHYDEIGLLRPARVDAASGYRWYAREQALTAQVIALLRSVDMPLAEIADLVGGNGEEPAAAARERYLTNRDDGVDPSAYRTEIVWPLR